MTQRFEYHTHTHYSNIRLPDSTNKAEQLIQRAVELGLAGIAITDHESLGSHVELDRIQEDYKEKYPDFKIVRGNEIYLTNTRESNQKYYHFILLALDAIGHKMLRELSSNAWMHSYFDRGMERVVTLKTDIEQIIQKYGQGHLYASTACIGGELGQNILALNEAEIMMNINGAKQAHENIVNFLLWCIDTFGKEYFSLEVQPGRSDEQLIVNKRIVSIAQAFDLPIGLTTDAHYLTKEDRFVHKALLNSRDGEREVDSFYEYCYLQSEEEIKKNLQDTGLDYDKLCQHSMHIYDKCQYYTLKRKQHVKEVKVTDYAKESPQSHTFNVDKYPTLDSLAHSDNIQERYWINYCANALKQKNLYNDTYLARLEEEADIQKVIGDKLETCMFAYPIFLQHYINLIWDCGSTVGAGRGSACAGLNHWLLGVTQLDPIVNNLPYWR